MNLPTDPITPTLDRHGFAPTREVRHLLVDGRRKFLRVWMRTTEPHDTELRVIVGDEHDAKLAQWRAQEIEDEEARDVALAGAGMGCRVGVAPRSRRAPEAHGVGASGRRLTR